MIHSEINNRELKEAFDVAGGSAAAPARATASDKSSPNEGNGRTFISGGASIAISFLLDLLKLAYENRQIMTNFNTESIAAQGQVFEAQAQQQLNLYNHMSDETWMDMVSQAGQAGMSAAQLGIGVSGAFNGTIKEASEMASLRNQHLESFSKISAETDNFTGDAPADGNAAPEDPFANLPEDRQAALAAVRQKLVNGNFDAKALGANFEEAEIHGFNIKEVIQSTPLEHESGVSRNAMEIKLIELRKQANEQVTQAQQHWSTKTNLAQSAGQALSSGVGAVATSAKSHEKQAQGAAQAALQEAQGTSQQLKSAEQATTQQKQEMNQEISQVLQTIRELVSADVRA